ncbi:hypothetical protein AAG906_025775 [Vitis piasezkii]
MEITELCKSNVPTRDDGPIRKVAFLRTSGLASTAGRLPLLGVRFAPSEVLWVLSLGCCRSEVFLLVPRNLDTAGLFPFRPGEDASTGARFGGMSIQMGFSYCVRMKKTEVEDGRVQVSREDEEEWSRRQRGWG